MTSHIPKPRFRTTSPGEELFEHLAQRIYFNRSQYANNTSYIHYGDESWDQYNVDANAMYYARRLVSIAQSLTTLSLHQDHAVLQIESHIHKFNIFDTKRQVRKIAALSLESALESGKQISKSTKQRCWAECLPECYLCGHPVGDSSVTNLTPHVRPGTLDHVWPQTWGGASSEDNLLPACAECNRRKDHMATWACFSIQTVAFGLQHHSEKKLETAPGPLRFAVYQRAVMRRARERGLTLKKAAMSLGPSLPLAIESNNTDAHFFNLTVSRDDA